MFGLLNLDKPSGKTSRDVVNQVSRLIRGVKVGHAGTLDPLATGVLVVGVGPATRLVSYVQRMPKTYEAAFLLGRTSETEDVEGHVVELSNPRIPTRSALLAAIPHFIGQIEQIPPAFSALKISGRRAYDLARRGESVTLAPRRITIHNIHLVEYEYPLLRLTIRCGSGTYIRSLGRDLARALGTEAAMSELTRTAIGVFPIQQAIAADGLTLESLGQALLPAATAVNDLPAITLTTDEVYRLGNGLRLENRWGVSAPEIAALNAKGDLVAIAEPEANGRIKPVRNFPVP